MIDHGLIYPVGYRKVPIDRIGYSWTPNVKRSPLAGHIAVGECRRPSSPYAVIRVRKVAQKATLLLIRTLAVESI